MGGVHWKPVSLFVALGILLALVTPVMAKQQISVSPNASLEYLEPLIWHLDYPLNYLTLYPGAQGLGGEFTYSGSYGVNYGVSVFVHWSLFAPPPGATLGPILVKINYRGSTVAVLTKTFYGGVGSFTWYPELNRPFQVWITNLGSYSVNAWGTVSMWFD